MHITGKLQQAQEIQNQAKRQHAQNKWLSYAAYSRAHAEKRKHLFNLSTGECVGCGERMHARVFADNASTIFVCPSCSWTHTIPFAINEARRPGEGWGAGAGRIKGTPTVTIGIDGKIKGITGV